EEPVAFLDGVAVRAENAVLAGEGADQHQQRGARQVEVGEQPVDDPEAESRIDEQPGLAAQFAGLRGGFERAQRSRAYGEHAAAAECVHGLPRDGIALGMHAVVLDPLAAYRLKRADPDMQGQLRQARAATAPGTAAYTVW